MLWDRRTDFGLVDIMRLTRKYVVAKDGDGIAGTQDESWPHARY